MKCQILFSGKNKKNISKCRLLKILPRVLSVKHSDTSSVCCLEYINIPADVAATFANSKSDYPFKQNI